MKRFLLLLAVLPLALQAAIQYSGGTYVNTTYTTDGTKQGLINKIEDSLNTAGWTTVNGIDSGTYTSGASVTGTVGQTCNVTTFNNGLTGQTVTVALTGTNALAGGTAFVITNRGSGATAAPTSAVLTAGTAAACSGTIVIATVISNHHSTNVFLQSAVTTAGSLQIGIRIRDNAGVSVQLYLESSDGLTLKPGTEDGSSGASLRVEALKVYTIVASRYQFLVFTLNAFLNPREFMWAGMPYVPSFETSTITRAGFLFGVNRTDSDTTLFANISAGPGICSDTLLSGSGCANLNVMYNSNYWEERNTTATDDGGNIGLPKLLLASITDFSAPAPIAPNRWFGTNGFFSSDVYIAWGKTAISAEAFLMGQVYDCSYSAESLAIGNTVTFDSPSHTFYQLGGSGGVRNGAVRGGLMFAVN